MIGRILLVLIAGFSLVPNATAQAIAETRTDSLGDPLPTGAIARLGTLRLKHNDSASMLANIGVRFPPTTTSFIKHAVFSPDGAKIASLDGLVDTLCLWDAATGKGLRGPWNLKDDFRSFSATAFSPDSAVFAASGGDRRRGNRFITTWDIATARELLAIDYDPKYGVPQSLAFAQDGKSLIVAGPGGVRWLDAATGKEQRTWQPVDAPPEKLPNVDLKQPLTSHTYTLSPKGNQLAVHLHALTTEKVNGKTKTQILENEVRGFELATGKSRWRAQGQKDIFLGHVAFSPDETRVAVGVASNMVELYDTTTGKLLKIPSLPDDTQRFSKLNASVALSSVNNSFAVSYADGRVFVSDPDDPARYRQITTRITLKPLVRRCLDFSPNGKTLLVGTGVDLQLYDVGTLQEVVAWEGHRSAVERIAFSADGRRLVTGSVHLNYMNPQEVATWDSQSWKRLHLASASNPQWPKIGIASFDRTVYVGKNGEDQANLYDFASGKQLGRFPGFDKPDAVPMNFFSPGSKFFVQSITGRNPETRVYAVPSCKLVCQLPFSSAILNRPDAVPLAFSMDERFIAMIQAQNGVIDIIETATGKVHRRLGQAAATIPLRPFLSEAGALAFSADAKLLASWSPLDAGVRIWDVAAGKEWVRLAPDGDQHYSLSLAWSPDGRMLAVGDHKIQLWEVSSGKLRREFTGHEGDIRSLAFSPDGRLLASGSTDTTVLIWDVYGH